jgi:hypothetical protein
MAWGEFKAAVEAAGVLDDDNVDDLSAMVNTDGSPALSLLCSPTSLGGGRFQRQSG